MYPQTELFMSKRLINLDDEFTDVTVLNNHQILLLDYLMTTFPILKAAARCFKEGSAIIVGVLFLREMVRDSFEI